MTIRWPDPPPSTQRVVLYMAMGLLALIAAGLLLALVGLID